MSIQWQPNIRNQLLKPQELTPGLWELSLPKNWEGGKISWQTPLCDIAGRWQPGAGPDRNLPISWERERNKHSSSAGLWAPVTALLAQDDANRGCIAVSQAIETVHISCGVVEDKGLIQWGIELPPGSASLRFDVRNTHLTECLKQVCQWWESLAECGPSTPPVDERGRTPLYSTWYAYRQSIRQEDIEREARLAKDYGLGGIIVDDGWQQTDQVNHMGQTGSWQAHRLGPHPQQHIQDIQKLGMTYMLWMSLPFIGYLDEQLEQFKKQGWILAEQERIHAAVVDPRFPAVRSWLVGHCLRLVTELGIDGLKLDFLDRFAQVWDGEKRLDQGRDVDSIGAAVLLLLDEIETEIHGRYPQLPIEFRQRYIGPIPRRCGNILRAMDCPNDYTENRRRIVDTRLLAGSATVHGDMIYWHQDDPTESAARQIIASLYAVPQISVRLLTLSEPHQLMLKHWMNFWNTNKTVLLDGSFMAHDHLGSWSHLSSSNETTQIDTLYTDKPCRWSEQSPAKRILVNGSHQNTMTIIGPHPQGRIEVVDCVGNSLTSFEIDEHQNDCLCFHIPVSGIATFTADA